MRHTRTPFKALTYNIYMVERGLRLHTGILVLDISNQDK